MPEQEVINQHRNEDSLLPKATVYLVRFFGSWLSVFIHTLIFVGWFWLKLDLEVLLVVVSLEAIYIGIFILMAENVETRERERRHEVSRQKDMKIIKQDVRVDEKSLAELKTIKKQMNTLHNLIAEIKDK